MITHSGITETDPLIFKKFGINEDEFYSLPPEYQKAIVFNCWYTRINDAAKKNTYNKNVKKKILSIFNNK